MKTLHSITITTAAVALAFGMGSGAAFAAPQTTPQQAPPQQQTTPMNQSGQNQMHSRSNMQTRTQVKQKLRQLRGVDSSSVMVRVSNGTVTLTGSVSSQSDRTKVVNAVKNVRGVNNVNASRLKVKSQGNGMQGNGM